jgi:acetyltransferase
MLGGAEPAEFSHCLSTLLDDPGVDAFLPILVPQALVDPGDVARAIVENANKTQKPVLACMVGEKSLDEARKVLHQNKVPMTIFPEVPGPVLGAMATYKRWKDKLRSKAFSFSDINRSEVARALSWVNKAALGEADTRPILEAYGMTLVPGGFAEGFAQASAIAGDIGYPVALKVVSEQILHKSDMGGIALNIDSDSALKNAIEAMKVKITAAANDAIIDGYLVEKMALKGLEVIVGMRRDPTFGPLVMFGLGGVYVELFKDVGFGIAPLSPEYAEEMIFSTKAGRLLQAFRGGPVYDLDAVVEVIGRLSQLSLDFPQVSEIEINPLLVLPEGEGAIVLDARIIMADK